MNESYDTSLCDGTVHGPFRCVAAFRGLRRISEESDDESPNRPATQSPFEPQAAASSSSESIEEEASERKRQVCEENGSSVRDDEDISNIDGGPKLKNKRRSICNKTLVTSLVIVWRKYLLRDCRLYPCASFSLITCIHVHVVAHSNVTYIRFSCVLWPQILSASKTALMLPLTLKRHLPELQIWYKHRSKLSCVQSSCRRKHCLLQGRDDDDDNFVEDEVQHTDSDVEEDKTQVHTFVTVFYTCTMLSHQEAQAVDM